MKPYQLDKNYRVVRDPNCYALQKITKSGKQGMEWKAIEWHVNLNSLANSYLSRSVRESGKDMPHAIEDAVRALREASETLRTSLTVTL